MKISYCLNDNQTNNLCCHITDDNDEVTFEMGYTVNPKKWNSKKEEIDQEDIRYFTLSHFKQYITKRQEELKKEGNGTVVTFVKNEILPFIEKEGIEGLECKLFDDENRNDDVPEYKDFIRAFEKFSGLKRSDYKIEAIESFILFHTKDSVYEMDTYEGKTKRLRSMIDNRYYEDIFVATNAAIWSEIYLDGGISKGEFIPQMQKEWEIYWNEKFRNAMENNGNVNRLTQLKETSWKRFQVYMECFDENADIIDAAFEIDMDVLYPLAIITMMNIFDADTCYTEYCEMEFAEWEDIVLDEDSTNSLYFHIRPYEFI